MQLTPPFLVKFFVQTATIRCYRWKIEGQYYLDLSCDLFTNYFFWQFTAFYLAQRLWWCQWWSLIILKCICRFHLCRAWRRLVHRQSSMECCTHQGPDSASSLLVLSMDWIRIRTTAHSSCPSKSSGMCQAREHSIFSEPCIFLSSNISEVTSLVLCSRHHRCRGRAQGSWRLVIRDFPTLVPCTTSSLRWP